MRRWLILFLLTVLPLQFASAGAASYCLHERDSTAWHLGHHPHEHRSPKATVASDTVDSQKANPAGLDDPDCGYCHLSAAHTLLQDFGQPRGTPPGDIPAMAPVPGFGHRDPDTLDRPNWLALA